ncbi:CKLF-like MARVEL transmembrane domain-containing protein 4 isoform X2 [Plodia interpunctella]|nr:CKLF-like MARVEL transmembrane domain-containing protein 4 isoform X2 [Plodia interpunctella]XP_053599961.1 CKLF-like MARVEL transmembrane domain-containing protein 4 isoform X2 [Plodia interpunctella]XP_053599970.1 CKLF-like MARVEL transmembrane domain-containing protein 4 isoform X2 [Plodia interpunctella]
MAEVGFPGQHTTTTTVTSSTTVQTNLRFDPLYVRTIPGILKVVQVVSSLIGFLCIQLSRYSHLSKGAYFIWISMFAFWFSGILLFLYLFHMVEKFYKIPWLKIEFVFCALWTLLYLIAASIATSVYDGGYSAGAFFGFAATLAYAIDAFLKWRAVRAGGLAQGARVVSKQTTSVERPPPPPRQGY